MIGACVKTQTISLDDEMKLILGVPLYIDFDQIFENVYIDECPITEMPVSALLDAIDNLSDVRVDVRKDDSQTEYNPYILAELEDAMEKERKAEEKWKRNHKHISTKKAIKNFDRIYEDIMWG